MQLQSLRQLTQLTLPAVRLVRVRVTRLTGGAHARTGGRRTNLHGARQPRTRSAPPRHGQPHQRAEDFLTEVFNLRF
jgi:hypothetical protein